ncbi:hypothetical protein Vi05172_g7748 [Venturia inaequalis]|nr:hypothetical protein Vi05172_g7748 [Venturia inaequalis]
MQAPNPQSDVEKAATINVQETKAPQEHSVSTKADSTSNDKPNRVDTWYLWEIGGIIGSAACICAIIGLLASLNGKKLPVWGATTPEKIVGGTSIPSKTVNVTLNSVISWISTVGKIAILIPITKGLGQLKWVWFAEKERQLADLETFDGATRGLTGSAKLLWKLRGRQFAVIGAIAMILALGFDPFIQNLVHYDTVYMPDPDRPSSIVTANEFDIPEPFGQLGSDAKGRIQSGMYSVSSSLRVPTYSCDTGNCTWIGYNTLGVGVHCADLTSDLVRTCSNDTALQNSVMGAPCNYRLPNGMNLGSDDGHNVFAVNLSRASIKYSNYSNPLTLVQTIGAFNNEYINASVQVLAAECVLFPAIKKLNSSVGQWYLDNVDPNALVSTSTFTGDFYVEQEISMYDNYTYTSALDDRASAGYHLSSEKHPGINGQTTYSMSNKVVIGVQRYMKTLFQGFVRGNGPSNFTYVAEENAGGSSDALQFLVDPSAGGNCRDSTFFGEFNGSTSVQCTIESISIALTLWMRDSQMTAMIPGDQAAMLNATTGNTIAPITQVNVTWWWISLPIVIWLCSVVMLIGTAYKTKKAHLYNWRTSPLAMAFMQLGREEKQAFTGHGLTEDGLIRRAELMKVQLKVQDGEDILMKKSA